MAQASAAHPPELPPTPDFDSYPIETALTGAASDGRVVTLTWSDGRESRFHALWLRDNAADPETINPQTRERTLDMSTLPEDLRAAAAWIDEGGALCLRFLPEDRVIRYHPGWLRARDYSNGGVLDISATAPLPWDAVSLPEPPSFDGAAALEDDAALGEGLEAVLRHGIVRFVGVPAEPGMVERFVRRIGPPRESNFGLIFDVRSKPRPDSNAYTSLALQPHTDLPTREYEPGLQLLHCLENTCAGGRSIIVDGFKLAEIIREEDPAAYRSLTETPWTFTNRAETTDYRWRSPVIVLDPAGRPREVRVNSIVRGPLQVPFDQVEEAYRALRLFFAKLRQPRFAMTFRYRPGDLLVMDNRRVAHGRDAFEAEGGERWLQGCYLERDELWSRLRVIERQRRAGTLKSTSNATPGAHAEQP